MAAHSRDQPIQITGTPAAASTDAMKMCESRLLGQGHHETAQDIWKKNPTASASARTPTPIRVERIAVLRRRSG